MQPQRIILHCDLNNFYASVETRLNSALRDVPMAVCGDPHSRHGIILAKNELAKAFGIKTAETIYSAKKKCPDLVLTPPHHDEYFKYSELVNQIYLKKTDLVEPFGIDESWLDVTNSAHLFGSGVEIADALRREVQEQLGLTLSVGVSFNKIFAKLGSDYKKPDATTEITREGYQKIVWEMPVGALLYVGRQAQKVFDTLYIKTIGDLARSDPRLLESKLGRLGPQLWQYANGEDCAPVASFYDRQPPKSVGNGTTFWRNLLGESDLRVAVQSLSDEVATRLRKLGLCCTVVAVSLKDPAFQTISRQRTLPVATNLAKEISDMAMELILAHWDIEKPVRALTITAMQLLEESSAGQQLTLFSAGDVRRDKQQELEQTMDRLRQKFGRQALSTANLIKSDLMGSSSSHDE